MKITKWQKPDDTVVAFTDAQRVALDRAGLWRGYRLVVSLPSGTPTYTDADIADMIGASGKMTRIAHKRRPYTDAANYIVVDPRGGADIACESIQTALDTAKEAGARVVTIDARDMHGVYYKYASDRSITLLAV